MNTVPGDLIALAQAGRFNVIAHGCNCHCTMGAGIAKGIKATFPAAWDADRATKPGDRAKLGTCTAATISLVTGDLVVVNAYTQYDWRGSGVKVDYDAVTSCMAWIKRTHPGRDPWQHPPGPVLLPPTRRMASSRSGQRCPA